MNIEKLQRFGDEASRGLSQTLGALLGREVSVQEPRVSGSDAMSLAAGLDSAYLAAVLKGSGGLEGTSLLLAKEKECSVMADLLIGQDGTAAPDKMTELHLSAFGEVLHQMVEVLSGEAKKTAGNRALWEVGETSAVDSSRAGNKLASLGDGMMVFQFGFSVRDLLAGEFLLCLPGSVAEKLSAEAGKPAAQAAVQNQPGVSTLNTQMRAGGASVQQLENEFSGSSRPAGGNIGLLMDVPLKLTVELGRTTKLVKEILALAPGSVVELDKLAGEAVDILVNEKLIAKGEVVVIDENFGVRITEIINPEERLHAVQA